MNMPFVWRIRRVKGEQATTVNGDFKHEAPSEIARCLNMPFNVAAGNGSIRWSPATRCSSSPGVPPVGPRVLRRDLYLSLVCLRRTSLTNLGRSSVASFDI